jgi:hypothetical protein
MKRRIGAGRSNRSIHEYYLPNAYLVMATEAQQGCTAGA